MLSGCNPKLQEENEEPLEYFHCILDHQNDFTSKNTRDISKQQTRAKESGDDARPTKRVYTGAEESDNIANLEGFFAEEELLQTQGSFPPILNRVPGLPAYAFPHPVGYEDFLLDEILELHTCYRCNKEIVQWKIFLVMMLTTGLFIFMGP
mmetsp:Transcript_10548/g.13695  ORF Transcript_10548/g.13695 Transcript_10548/m.13695 type:complete len:151 (+) Transcript_10548:64-516(+)